MSEWRPIETLEREGQKIIAGAWIGNAANEGRCWVSALCFAMNDNLLWEGGVFLNWRATHWMPLPSPPEDTGS